MWYVGQRAKVYTNRNVKYIFSENFCRKYCPVRWLCYNQVMTDETPVKYIIKGVDHMRLKITGRNIELTEGLKAAVEERLSRLDKYFNDDTIANVTMSVEKERQKIEVTIPINGGVIRSEQVSSDMYVSIDLVEETIERQLKKHRQKLITKQQAADSDFKQVFLDAEDEEDVEQIKIVRSKKFDMKPMYAEDACIQMDLLGHDFFVFRNAETDEINVVYKRRGNTYGLIEPDF